MIEDGCRISPVTGLREHPSDLGLVIWWLHVFSFLTGVSAAARLRRWPRGWLAVHALAAAVGLGLYLSFQQRCRAWTGWLVYLGVGLLTGTVLSLVVGGPDGGGGALAAEGEAFEPTALRRCLPAVPADGGGAR